MINSLTRSSVSAAILSIAILVGYVFVLQVSDVQELILMGLLFVQGVFLNALCTRYSILGIKSQLPLILFIVISVIILPNIALRHLVLGFVWLVAFFLAFESREDDKKSMNYILFFGVVLGIAQAIENTSILLFLPVVLLFVQTGKRSTKSFLLSFMYFLMVILSYAGILFVMEIPDKIMGLIPSLLFDYTVFDTIVIRLFFPLVIVNLIMHFLKIGNYPFRYPNRTKILNYTLALQLAIAVFLVLSTAQIEFLIYFVHPAAVLLSFAYAYNAKNTFVNSAILALMFTAGASLVAYRALFL
ncbi:MAG: hypothetical protein RLZZ337_615 [Bacteroidota bacterium]